MLKKSPTNIADPDDGDALVDDCVTSVTTGRTMAEIASGEDVWHSKTAGRKRAAGKEVGGQGAAAVPAAATCDPGRRGADRRFLDPRI